MLLSIKLTNFKKHKSLEVDFSKGLNVVKGQNFCGKSTLLKAIAVALYGITGAGAKSRICTTGESKWKLELTMKIAGKEYLVTRSGSTASVIHDKEVIARGNSIVTNWVTENTGANLDEFLTHTYSKQMETSTLLTMGSSKLQNKVEKLSKVDVVDKVLKLLTEKTSSTKGKLELLGETNLANSKKLFKSVTTSHEFAKKKFNRSLQAISESKLKISEIETVISTAILNQDNLDQELNFKIAVQNGIVVMDECLARLTSKVKNLPSVSKEELSAMIVESDEIYKTIINDSEKVSNKEKLKISIMLKNKWISEVGKPNLTEELRLSPLIDIAEKELDGSRKVLNQKITLVNIALDKSNQLKKALLDSTCPTCNRDYESTNKKDIQLSIKNSELEVEQLTEKCKKVEQIVMDNQHTIGKLAEQFPGEGHAQIIKDEELLVCKLEESLEELIDIPTREELEIMKEKLSPMRSKIEADKSTLNVLQGLEDGIKENKSKLLSGSENLLMSNNKIKELEKFDRDVTTPTKTLSRWVSVLNDNENFLQADREKLSYLEIELALAKQTLENDEKISEKFSTLTKELGLYSHLTKYLRDSRTRFVGGVWSRILARATEIVSNATAGNEDQITELSRDEKGMFMYSEKGEQFGIADASGCQMEMMGVAMRLSLCDLFYGDSSYMMLDEASSQMNNENASALAGVLASTGKQIIYVTHRETEETSASNVITLGQEG